MAGNWKMFKNASETSAFFEKFLPLTASSTHCEIVIAPPFVNIPAAVAAAGSSRVEIGAQNLHWTNEGAFTGEVSGPMLKSVGCNWVIIGHSERRQYFGETDEKVAKRTYAAVEHALKPIVCVGERLEEREGGRTESVLKSQFDGGLSALTPAQFAQVTIAYEPVWAIGTGRTATPDQAQEVHGFIRRLTDRIDASASGQLPILYGGSVKADNARGLLGQPDIDGALVGGASLKADEFVAIINAA